MLGEERFVGGVDGGEIVQVFNEDRSFYDVAYFQACCFYDSFNVFQRLTRLSGHVFRYGTGFWVNRDLTGSDYHATQINTLNVWADCCWCIFRRDSLAHDFS